MVVSGVGVRIFSIISVVSVVEELDARLGDLRVISARSCFADNRLLLSSLLKSSNKGSANDNFSVIVLLVFGASRSEN